MVSPCSWPFLASIAAPCAPLVPAFIELSWFCQRGSAASECSSLVCPCWVGQGWLTWPAFYCCGLCLVVDLFLGVRASRACGDGDAVPCHVHSAPCCVFKAQTAAVMASTMACSQLDPKALPAALASAFFAPAVPLPQNSCLSPLTSLSSQQRGGQACRRLLALLGCAGVGLESTVMKVLDATSASCALCTACSGAELQWLQRQHWSQCRNCSSSEVSRAEPWNWKHTQTFPTGSNPGEITQSSSHRAELIPSKQDLANKPWPHVPAGFKVKVRKFQS